MNLFERVQDLEIRIKSLTGLRARSNQADKFERRAKDLSLPSNALERLKPSMNIVLSRGIKCDALNKELIQSIHARITDLRSRYANDKNVIIDPFPGEDTRYIFTQPLAGLPANVDSALKNAWKVWAGNKLPKIDREVLEILANINSLKISVQNIKSLQIRADEICNRLPENEATVNELTQLCERIATTWHELTGDGIPPEVMSFLRAAGSYNGVGVEALTAEVFDWLRQHNLSKSLRIRMG